MQRENYWHKQKEEIFKIIANVFLILPNNPPAEGRAFKPVSETDKANLSYLNSLGIKLEPGSEAEKAMLMYLSGLKCKYSEYQHRISFWSISVCLGDTICTTPTLRKIKERYPNYPIDVYCRYPDIFRYNKNADKVITFENFAKTGTSSCHNF
jgi:hypothetical protein